MRPTDSEMITIPLPLEIPPPPALENLPLDILHSAAVEMLIQQNEDLSSRLKVNIRRNSQLEQKIIELEIKIKDVLRQQQTYQSQFEIANEKEKIWLEQKESKSRQTESLEKEISLLNLRYNELYTTSQQLQKQSQQELILKNDTISKLLKKNQILFKIKNRSKDKLRQFLLEIAEKFQSLDRELTQSQSTNRVIKNNFDSLKSEFLDKETLFKEQFESFKNISFESNKKLQLKIEEFQLNKDFITEQIKELKNENSELTESLFQEKKGRLKIKQLSEENSLLKNEKVKIRHDFDKKINLLEQSAQITTDKNREITNKKNQIEKELFEQKTITEACELKMLGLIKDNKEISTQLETIQKLWIQAQEKLEKEELKRESLEKINRELSQSYKKNRVERSITSSTTSESKTEPYRTISVKAGLDL